MHEECHIMAGYFEGNEWDKYLKIRWDKKKKDVIMKRLLQSQLV